MFELEHVRGNLFDSSLCKAHCISADWKLGAGIAKQFRQRFGVPATLLQAGIKVGKVGVQKLQDKTFVFHLVTKSRYWHKPTYASLKNALESLRAAMDEHGVKQVAMPEIGCGLDRLEWNRVEKLVSAVFDDSDCKMVVVTLP